MISRRFTRWQQLAALAPALLLLVALPAQVMLRCRIDGLLRSQCCCAHPDADEQKSSGPAMEAQACCDREVVAQGERPAADVARSPAPDLAPTGSIAAVIPEVPLLAPAPDRFDRTATRYGPAREGPPLVLLKHAFLI